LSAQVVFLPLILLLDIFHEVRVPFNAIVLGIEQLQMELAPHYALVPGSIDTLDIISEQSSVVSRILNDVLSMQKIEDGALALEYDQFSLEKMIRGALYAFRTPCLEKRLKVRVNLQSLDQLVNESLPGLRLGKVIHSSPHSSRGGGVGGGHIVPVSSPAGGVEKGILGRGKPVTTQVAGSEGGSLGSAVHGLAAVSGTGGASNYSQNAGLVHHANVRGDPYRLRQVLANFVSNGQTVSRKFVHICV
jgi:signal transduction histidine kinase